VHDDVNPGDAFADHTDLAQLAGRAAGHLDEAIDQ